MSLEHNKIDRLVLPTPSEINGVALSSRNEGFKLPNHLLDGISEMHERWQNRLELEETNIAKAYFEGRIGVLVNFERHGTRAFDGNVQKPIGILGHTDVQRRTNDSQDHVLIYHVQVMQGVDQMPFTIFEKFESLEEIRQIASGCFYSFTRGYVISPILRDRQFGPSVLCTTVKPSQFPIRVIESGAQIVNDIGDNQREVGWRRLAKVNIDPTLPVFRVFGNSNSMGVCLSKQSQKVFKISDMMLGPLNL